MTNTTESKPMRLPELGETIRTVGKLVEIEDVTPSERVLDYIFETTEARVEARVRGEVIRVFSTFNDFYGEGTSITGAIQEAKKLAERYDAEGLEMVVVKITSRIRMRPDHQAKEHYYAKGLRAMKPLASGARYRLPDDTEEVVWSSNEDEETNPQEKRDA